MTAPAAAPATPKGEREKTAYHVLKQTNARDATPTFQRVASDITAPNADSAIRAYIEKKQAEAGNAATSDQADMDYVGGTYIAIPTRSWKPVTVLAETKTVFTLN